MWLWTFYLFSNFIFSGWFVAIFLLIFKRTREFYGERQKPRSWITISMGVIFLGLSTFTITAITFLDPYIALGEELSGMALYGVLGYLLLEYAAMSSLFYGFLRLLREPQG
jgi:hypothetical protein